MNMVDTETGDASIPPPQPQVYPQQVLEEPQGMSLNAPSASSASLLPLLV